MKNKENIDFVYYELIDYLPDDITLEICEYIKDDELISFLIMQIKNDNYEILSILLSILKKNEYYKEILNNNIIKLLAISIGNSKMFLHLCEWLDEFGFNNTTIDNSTIIAFYIESIFSPEIKSKVLNIMKSIKHTIKIQTMYFITDDVDTILSYINIKPINKQNTIMLDSMILNCYQYNSANILKKIQTIQKYKFFSLSWYTFSPYLFEHVMKINNRDPYKDEIFSSQWITYVCSISRWDYIPMMINKLTPEMWYVISTYFYMGILLQDFVVVLFHQMKKNNIPIKKLYLENIYFNSKSTYTNYLIKNNYYYLFSTEHFKVRPIIPIKNAAPDVYEASITSIPLLLSVSDNINDLVDIISEISLNLTNRYTLDIKYIDSLIDNNELGWDEDITKKYNNMKTNSLNIINELNMTHLMCIKYNQYVLMDNTKLSIGYKLRFINEIIDIYELLKIDKFKKDFMKIYSNCLEIKKICIAIIRKQINSKKNPNEFYKLPENPNIYDHFQNLIENCKNYNFSNKNSNNTYIELLNDHEKIKRIVELMLNDYAVPLQDIRPIIYNHYNKYTDKEHFFLE